MILEEIIRKKDSADAVATTIKGVFIPKRVKINVVGLGDVGANFVLGLKILGSKVIGEIGLYSRRKESALRLEREFNQIYEAFSLKDTPTIKVIEEEELFDCDIFVFAASASIPSIGEEKNVDVRMIQLEENGKLIEIYSRRAQDKNFQGLFAVLSDPVDHLCLKAFETGLNPYQIKGFGLGVMNARAIYYSKKVNGCENYKVEGRAYGPHGKGLVIANSISSYNGKASIELTKLALEANLEVRNLGYKPFYAPSISSGAYSLIAVIKGDWHYSSVYIDGYYLGIKNRSVDNKVEIEKVLMCDELFNRIKKIWW